MKFGDLYAHQIKGIAMGMSPAPSIANLYVAIYERDHLNPCQHTALHFLRRFIDDGFGIWLRDPNPQTDNDNWTTFQNTINTMGLTWEFSPRSNTVNFMDIVITLTNGKFTTKLYSKPSALAKSDKRFSRSQTISSASVASDRGANERTVNVSKRAGYIKRGLRPNMCPINFHKAWKTTAFKANFMYKPVL